MKPICKCHSIEFIPIGEQAQAFISALNPENRAKLLAAAESTALGFAHGRPHGSRTTLIGSAMMSGLFVLRVIWPGAPEPQLRLICIREDSRVLVARGFVQNESHTPVSEVKLAERAILCAREVSNELKAEKACQ